MDNKERTKIMKENLPEWVAVLMKAYESYLSNKKDSLEDYDE